MFLLVPVIATLFFPAGDLILAIITDGSRILGLGNIGPEAGLPVMEAKANEGKEK